MLYDDDGETYNYLQGEYSRIEIKITPDTNNQKQGSVKLTEGQKTWSFSDYTFRYMTE
ncbi:MAG: DUF5110 domain-containing protein [Tannerellaceae bacterium]|nr:DUF5110 domain-containing protein [Tannerellaceae bacterium]